MDRGGSVDWLETGSRVNGVISAERSADMNTVDGSTVDDMKHEMVQRRTAVR